MNENETPKPPKHLGPAGRRLWEELHRDYELDGGDVLALLETACVALDRLAQAREIIAEEGAVTKDRYGSPKQHPACLLERDSRNGLLSALRALNLDPGTQQDAVPRFLGRPPGIRSAH